MIGIPADSRWGVKCTNGMVKPLTCVATARRDIRVSLPGALKFRATMRGRPFCLVCGTAPRHTLSGRSPAKPRLCIHWRAESSLAAVPNFWDPFLPFSLSRWTSARFRQAARRSSDWLRRPSKSGRTWWYRAALRLDVRGRVDWLRWPAAGSLAGPCRAVAFLRARGQKAAG